MNKIQTTSSSLKVFFSILTPLPAILLISIWIIAAYMHYHTLALLFGFPDKSLTFINTTSISINIVGLILFGAMAAIQTYLFWQLRTLFAEYAKGKIFSHKSSKLLYRISLAFLCLTLFSILVISVCSFLLLANHMIEFRSLIITAGILQGCNILISITLLVFSWVVEEGRIIKEESDYTV
jgi:hypothetical protein